MSFFLQRESDRLRGAIRQVDWQTATVLLFAALAVILQMNYGDRGFFRRDIASLFTDEPTGLHGWIWWFGMQGVLGFLLPIAILRLGFRNSFSAMGLGAGDWRFSVRISLLYLPLVIVGTWFLSIHRLLRTTTLITLLQPRIGAFSSYMRRFFSSIGLGGSTCGEDSSYLEPLEPSVSWQSLYRQFHLP
ncbi:MAG: hypothetical protein O3A57_09975 [Bacteroidetes bacterium]|nr:hypothetical protein [Bacteroidota bacterium]